MTRVLIGTVLVLHGLVHAWYIVLSQRLVAFKPEMGWTGESWLFTNLVGDSTTRLLASIAYGLALLAFVAGGIGYLARASWHQPMLVGAAVVSTAAIALFWDGSTQHLVEKGLLGLVINGVVLGAVLLGR